MRAALMVEAKQPFVVEDIEYYAPSPGRVLVRTGASPFCSTDCVNWRGELSKIPPTVLGHASMGYVEEVGANVTGLKVGRPRHRPGDVGVQRLLLLLHRPAGPVLGDVRPRRHLAGRRGAPQRRRRERRRQRRRLPEMMNVTANQVWAIESDLPDEWLGLLGCGITTGLGSIFHVAKVSRARASRSSASATSASGWSRPRRSRARARSSRSTRSPTAASWQVRSAPPTSSTRRRRLDRRRPGADRGPRRRRRHRGRDAGVGDAATRS